jgi:hypothetical protein
MKELLSMVVPLALGAAVSPPVPTVYDLDSGRHFIHRVL